MHTTIFYFTGTGNSLWVSRYLASKLGDTRLVSLPLSEEVDLSSSRRVGFVFPVIMFGLPLIIKRFVESVPLSRSTYIFAIATCGGKPFNTMKRLEQLIGARGLELSAGFNVEMVNSCTSIGEAIPVVKQQQQFERAKEALNRICLKIEEQERHIDKGIPGLNWYFGDVIHAKAEPQIPGAAQYFYFDKNCNGCGLCEKVCPVKNIGMDSMRPVWHNRCEQCYACLQWCPKEAVQVKNKKTEGLRRYHHPEITPADIIRK
ncbi:MAG TPA: EFR1 family ferrodoxin [Bacillota bacterium]